MAFTGNSASKSDNADSSRKRVEAETASVTLKRAKNGSDFTQREGCDQSVEVELISTPDCGLDAEIKTNHETICVEKTPSESITNEASYNNGDVLELGAFQIDGRSLNRRRPTVNESYAKALNSGSKESALQIMKDEQPRHFCLQFQNLSAKLDKSFQPPQTRFVSRYPLSSFTNVPHVMQSWADDYFSSSNATCPLSPKSIIIEGATRTGKTIWARSLGKHNYLCGRVDLSNKVYSNDAEYNVIDNVNPKCLKHWNELLGGKSDWQLNCKRGKPVQIKGGIPAIVLCNLGVGSSYMEYLDKSGNEGLKLWTLQNAVFIVLQAPLYST